MMKKKHDKKGKKTHPIYPTQVQTDGEKPCKFAVSQFHPSGLPAFRCPGGGQLRHLPPPPLWQWKLAW